MTKPSSITVDNSHIHDDGLTMAFYGIEDKGSSALVIGEQTLGRQASRGYAIPRHWSMSQINYC